MNTFTMTAALITYTTPSAAPYLEFNMSAIAPLLNASQLNKAQQLNESGYEITTFAKEQPLPLIIKSHDQKNINALEDRARDLALQIIQNTGGVLFRGFSVSSPLDFKRFAASFGKPLGSYEFGSTPRSKVFTGVYSSTEYPAYQSIPLHNEQSYTRQWPDWIWFHCMKPSSTGGETPIADSRLVFQRIPEAIREEFLTKELMYVRNYSESLDLTWQQVFNTQDRSQVERYCKNQGIDWQWKVNGELRTQQRCQAAVQHPQTGEWVWFNQAHLFHISAVEADLRATLTSAVGENNLPRNVYFGDGSPIPDTTLDRIRAVYAQTAIAFPWLAGDVLMLDNLLTAHGRNPFTGDRKVMVAMA